MNWLGPISLGLLSRYYSPSVSSCLAALLLPPRELARRLSSAEETAVDLAEQVEAMDKAKWAAVEERVVAGAATVEVETIPQAVQVEEGVAHLAEGTASEMEEGRSEAGKGGHSVLEVKASGLLGAQLAAVRAVEMAVGEMAVESEAAATALRQERWP